MSKCGDGWAASHEPLDKISREDRKYEYDKETEELRDLYSNNVEDGPKTLKEVFIRYLSKKLGVYE